MANPEHLKILKQGVEVWNKWRAHNQRIIPDLSNTDLTKFRFNSLDSEGTEDIQFALRVENYLSSLELMQATSRSPEFVYANLNNCNLSGADLTSVNLMGVHIQCSDLQGTILENAILLGSNLFKSDLGGAKLKNTIFIFAQCVETKFQCALISDSHFEKANLSNADFHRAEIANTKFNSSTCHCVKFSQVKLISNDFFEVEIGGSNFFRASGLDTSKNLETVKHNIKSGNEYLETISLSPWNKWVSWEKLNTIGKLPLFSVSSLSLVGILLLMFFNSSYNEKIDSIKKGIDGALVVSDSIRNDTTFHSSLIPIAGISLESPKAFLIQIKKGLKPMTVSFFLFIYFISSILLLIGSGINLLFSPDLIKSFNETEWVYQNKEERLIYLANSWSKLKTRKTCFWFYCLGAAGILIYIIPKFFKVGSLILSNL